MADDFVGIMLGLSNFIENERTSSYNEGMDVALASIKDFMRSELKIDPTPNTAVPDLLYEIKEHFDRRS
jgi:hypothetical protein